MKKRVSCELNVLSAESTHVYGSKACMLGVLTSLAMKVPTGYALPFSLFHGFIGHNAIQIDEQTCYSDSERIRAAILSGHFAEEDLSELEDIYNQVSKANTVAVVVRSSASGEDDMDHSMAGVFESFLNVSTLEDFVYSIKKCYASIFNDKVLHLLYVKQLSVEDVEMGIIVQQFVEGQYSGVAFTADVIGMTEETVHLQAVQGICHNFVSGKQKSSCYTVDKVTGRVSEKQQEGTLSLDERMIAKVVHASLIIESYFSTPQDIEWTLKDGELFILQTRPITTLKKKRFPVQWLKPEHAERTWFRVFDEPMKPFLKELYIESGALLSEGAWEAMISLNSYGEMQEHNGYLYFATKAHGLSVRQILEKRSKRFQKIWERFKKGENMFCDDVLPKLQNIVSAIKSSSQKNEIEGPDALRLLQLGIEYATLAKKWYWPIRLSYDCIDEFYKYCCTLKPDLKIEQYLDLIHENSLFAQTRELSSKMAAIVKCSPKLSALFANCYYDEILFARLKREPEAEQFMFLVEKALDTLGFYSVEDNLRVGATMYEQPHRVIGFVRGMMDIDPYDLRKNRKQIVSRKAILRNGLHKGLPIEEQRKFSVMLKSAEKSFVSIDNNNHYLVKMGYGPLRMAMEHVGDWLVQSALLSNKEDIYFLTHTEIQLLVHRGDRNLFCSTIAIRKALFEKQRRMTAPYFLGKDPIKHKKGKIAWSKLWPRRRKAILKGVSGLAVKTTGIVYKGFQHTGIVKERFATDVNENTILAIHSSHGGEDLMPFLRKIKGVVYGWGSPYDHPGIMARELGIPTLYDIDINALHEGDEIELDGILGRAKILRQADTRTHRRANKLPYS